MAMKPTIIDVSSSQKNMDLEAAKDAGVEGVIVKLTQGQTLVSPTWLTHSQDVDAADMLLGSYHYGHPALPTTTDSEKESAHYVEHIHQVPKQDIYPAIDLEEGKNEISDADLLRWTVAFIGFTCTSLSLKKSLCYCNGSYLKHLCRGANDLGTDLGLSDHLLWFAGSDPELKYTDIWSAPTLWQTMDREADWYDGRIDQNVLLAPLSDILIESGQSGVSGLLDKIDGAAADIEKWTSDIRTVLCGG